MKHFKRVMGPRSVVALFALHLDETAPHIHGLAVPITTDGKLGRNPRINEFLKELGKTFPEGRGGERAKYSFLQDDLYFTVSEKHGIARGKKGQTRKQEPIDGTKAAELRVTIAEEQWEMEEEARQNAKAHRILEQGRVERIYQEAEEAEKKRDEALKAKEAAEGEKTKLDASVTQTAESVERLQEEERKKAQRVRQLEDDASRLAKPLVALPSGPLGAVAAAVLPDVLVKSKAERGQALRVSDEHTIRGLRAQLVDERESSAALAAERDRMQKERDEGKKAKERALQEAADERERALAAQREELARQYRDEVDAAKKEVRTAQTLSAQRKELLDAANKSLVDKDEELQQAQHEETKAKNTAKNATAGIQSKLRDAHYGGRRQGWKEMALMVVKVFKWFLTDKAAEEWLQWQPLKDLLGAGQNAYTHELPDAVAEAQAHGVGPDRDVLGRDGPPR